MSASVNNATPTVQDSQSAVNASESFLTQCDVLYHPSMQLDVDESDSDSFGSEAEDQPNERENMEPSEEQFQEPIEGQNDDDADGVKNSSEQVVKNHSEPSNSNTKKPSRNKKSKVPTPFDNTKSPNKRRVSSFVDTVDVDEVMSLDNNRTAKAGSDSTKRMKRSGHSGPGITDEDLDGLSTMREDISAIRNIVSGLAVDIKKHVDDHLADLKRTIMNDINEIRVLVSHGFGDQKRKKETPRNEEANIPFFNIVFSDTTMQIVIEKCMIAHIISTTSDYITVYQRGKNDKGGDIARGAALAVRIMLFAINLKKKEGRVMYKSEIGTRFSEYREGIVLSALMAAKNNSFNIFRAAGETFDASENDQDTHVDMNSKKPQLPAWLKGDAINSKHINDVRLKMEETNGKSSEHNQTPTSAPSSTIANDTSIAAATQLYKNFTYKLNAARTCVKAGFYDEVGYLFSDWKQFGASADQSTLKLSWLIQRTFVVSMSILWMYRNQSPVTTSGSVKNVKRTKYCQRIGKTKSCSAN